MNAMKSLHSCITIAVTLVGVSTVAQGQSTGRAAPADVKRAVLQRLAEIQSAARALSPEKIYEFVLANDHGALVQNGEFFLTRDEAFQATRKGFEGLAKVGYKFDQQHVVLLSPTVALVTGAGSSSAVTDDGREFNTRFAQSVVLILADGDWKVFHAHRSFPPAK